MKCSVSLNACVCALFAQLLTAQVQPAPPAAEPAPDTVLAVVEGKDLTYGELKRYLATLSPEMQQAASRNKRELLREYVVMRQLTTMAEQAKLDQKSPYKEMIEGSRQRILTEAQLNEQYSSSVVTPDDQRKFYEANKDRFTQITLKVVYVPFVADGAAKSDKYYTESEAKQKAAEVVKLARGGADFTKLVAEYSRDETSKSKNGDFGTVRKSDNLPNEIRAAVFQLKQGEVSEPVAQKNGFYIFRAETVGLRPYDEVKDDIYTELKQARLNDWMNALTKSISIKIQNEAFFGEQQPTPPARPTE